MKNMTKKLIRGLIILISGIIVAMLLMIFTYLLPTGAAFQSNPAAAPKIQHILFIKRERIIE